MVEIELTKLGTKAVINKGQWSVADDKQLQDLLNRASTRLPRSPALGRYDVALAEFVLERFAGRIIKISEAEPKPKGILY